VSVRFVVVSLFCALLANCAARPGPETLAQSTIAPDGWGREAAEGEPARPKVRRVGQAAKSDEPMTTGSARMSAAERNGIKPLTPEWYAAEEAESQRLRRLTSICRC
jgi:hypothetical protein